MMRSLSGTRGAAAGSLDKGAYGGRIGSMRERKKAKRRKKGLCVTVSSARMCLRWGGAQAVQLHRNCL